MIMQAFVCIPDRFYVLHYKNNPTFSNGVYCGWWCFTTGSLSARLYATKKHQRRKSLSFLSLLWRRLQWKNRASPEVQCFISLLIIIYLHVYFVNYHNVLYVNYCIPCMWNNNVCKRFLFSPQKDFIYDLWSTATWFNIN